MDFGSGESFDEHHPPAALRASPEIAGTGGGGLLLGLRYRAEQLKTKWQGGGTSAIGQEAEISDAHEPFGEQVQQEAAQEFIDDRVSGLCSLLWAESRQRNVTSPSANETRRWLEMATRWV